MISDLELHDLVARASLAPSIHNAQPARWWRRGDTLVLGHDLSITLPHADPKNHGIDLSCGAAAEAMVLALSAIGYGANLRELKGIEGEFTRANMRVLAVIKPIPNGDIDPLHTSLETRFTARGGFADTPLNLFGWSRADTVFITDRPNRHWIAHANDAASYEVLCVRNFRRELLSWMRLGGQHPRSGIDGMNRASLGINASIARKIALGLGPLWPLARVTGRACGFIAEAEMSMTAPLIALFHRPKTESAFASGRAYLRLCLEAANLGLAGWPMAALGDHDASNSDICARFGITNDRRFIQAIRFGAPINLAPSRARRATEDILL